MRAAWSTWPRSAGGPATCSAPAKRPTRRCARRTARWSRWSSPPRRRPPSAAPARRGGWPTGCWPAPRPWSTGSSPGCRARACGRATRPSRRRRPRPCSIASPTSRRGPTGTHHAPTIGSPPSGSRSRRRRRRSCSASGTARPTSSPRRWPRRMRRPSWMRAGPRWWPARSIRPPSTSGSPCASRRPSRRRSWRRPRVPAAPGSRWCAVTPTASRATRRRHGRPTPWLPGAVPPERRSRARKKADLVPVSPVAEAAIGAGRRAGRAPGQEGGRCADARARSADRRSRRGGCRAPDSARAGRGDRDRRERAAETATGRGRRPRRAPMPAPGSSTGTAAGTDETPAD